jgi:outer membrane protein assembly factor BamB
MVKKIFFILFPVIATIVIALISCQFMVSTPELPVLKTPGDKAEDVSLKPSFEWGKDTTYEDTSYSLNLYRITDGGTELISTVEDVEGTQYTISQELNPSERYAWEIVYETKNDKTGSSGLHTFTTRKLADLSFSIPDSTVRENNTINIDLNRFLEDKENRQVSFELLSGPGRIVDDVYTYEPGYDDAGAYVVEIAAKDPYRETTATFELIVKDVYRPPVVKNIQETYQVDQGEQIAVDLNSKIENPDSNPLKFILAQGPGEIRDGVYYIQPDFSKKGRQQVKIIIEEPATQLEIDFHVVINAVNRSPSFGFIPIQKERENEKVEIDLKEYVTDPDGDTLTFLKTGGPGQISTDGLFTWQPDYDANGDYTIDFKVSDGVNMVTDSFLLSVENMNRKPVEEKDMGKTSYELKEGEPFRIDLSKQYTDPDDDLLTFKLIKGPGAIKDGQYTYLPDFDSHGESEIVVEISDGKDTLLSRYTFDVKNVNRKPDLSLETNSVSNASITRDAFKIDWESSDLDGENLTYNIYFGENASPNLCATNLKSTSWSPYEAGIKLKPNQEYFWQVEVVDESGSKTISELQTVVLENSPPKKPLITTKEHERKAIGMPYKLEWVCSDDDDALGHTYDIFCGESTKTMQLIASNINQESFILDDLQQGKEYFVKIVVEDPHGATNESDVFSLTVKMPPEPPESIPEEYYEEPLPATDVVLRWNRPMNGEDELLTYDIYLGTSKDTLKLIEKDATETSYKVQGLTGGTNYYWQVIVKDEYREKASGPIWEFKTDFGAGSLLWSYPVKYDIRSSPAISDEGTIYFGADDDYLYAIDREGQLIWKFDCGNIIYPSPSIGPDGRVYIAAGHKYIYAVDRMGSQLWRKEIASGCYSSPAVDQNGIVYIGDSDGILHAISPSGETLWTYQTADEIRSSPSVGKSGTIYFGSDDRSIYALNSDGSLKWTYETNGFVRSSPALDEDERVYVGSFDGKLYVLNKNGALIWEYDTGSQLRSSPSIYHDGTVYIGAFDGKLYAFDHLGNEKWSYSIEEGPFWSSSPAIGEDGTIYIGTWERQILAIDAKGNLKWRLETDDYIKSSPVIDENGALYIGTYGAQLLSIATDSKGLSTDSPWPMFRKDAKHTACQ